LSYFETLKSPLPKQNLVRIYRKSIPLSVDLLCHLAEEPQMPGRQ
jgi:hypothetical protein